MKAVLLHLSDIHIRDRNDGILSRASEIAACTYSSIPDAAHVFIVVSGDVANSGKESEYSLAESLLSQVQEHIQRERDIPISVVVVPGNHDCDFERDNAVRRNMVAHFEEHSEPEVDDSVIDACTSIQESFFVFQKRVERSNSVAGDLLWRTSVFDVEGTRISFDCLNISWVSKRREDPGKLYFPISRYSENPISEADIRLVVMHHPLNWFSQSMYRPFRKFIRERSHIIFSGHEHQANVGVVTEAETQASGFVEGAVLQGEADLSDSAFNVVVIDLTGNKFRSTQYRWTNKVDAYVATSDGSWADYKQLPAKANNQFEITSGFQQVLDDPGAFFKHPAGLDITLGDIYIFPDLRKARGESDAQRRAFVSAARLQEPGFIKSGVLIEGEEKAGRTSLLYQLFRIYHSRGFVPVLLRGKELGRVSASHLDERIRRAVSMQYGATCVETFEKLSRSTKVLLLDDFDDGPIRVADKRAEIIDALSKRFESIVITVGEMFEVRELLSANQAECLTGFEHYELQPFGHVLRGKLISKWLSLGADGTVGETEMLERRDQAEALMNAVMRKAWIPSAPLYLLTLLQSIDAGRGGDFKESALGYYYQYLLAEAFQQAGVDKEKLTEVFEYVVHLAWEFHVRNASELSEEELRGFNARFSRDWHSVDFGKRLAILLKARVLCKTGADYSFRYPYIYYYLKGKFLSDHLNDLDIRAYVEHCCEHLYVRDHANTILLLAHHSSDEFVLNAISGSLHSLFKGRAPIRFEGDTAAVDKLIVDAPKLTYKGGSPTEHRDRRNEIQDELDDGSDGLVEREEASDSLSLVAQVTTLFKTTEILGQVLKNQYAKIQRTRKQALIEELFNGPLRALQDFYEYCGRHPETLVAEIEASLEKNGKGKDPVERNAIARKVVSSLIQLVSFAFVLRAVQSGSSESLYEDVHALVSKRGTTAYKLIELGVRLESPKGIPRPMIKKLAEATEKEFIGKRILQMLAVNHLYMFKTSERDMQWLSEQLDIDLGYQHAITYQQNSRRKIK